MATAPQEEILKMKKQKIQDTLHTHNALIDADMNKRTTVAEPLKRKRKGSNIESSVPSLLKTMLIDKSPKLQLAAVSDLLKTISRNPKVVNEHDIVPAFVHSLSSCSDVIQEQATRALGIIAAISPHYRDLVLAHGAFTELLPHLKNLLPHLKNHSKLSLLRNATLALSIFCKGKPQLELHEVISYLGSLILSNDDQVLENVCWTLSHISEGALDSILDANFGFERLGLLLKHQSDSVVIPALRVIGNIATGRNQHAQHIIDGGVLPILSNLLNKGDNKRVTTEICWIISNIVLGNRTQVWAVFNENLIEQIEKLLHMTDLDHDTRAAAARAFLNAIINSNEEQTKIMVNLGCIKHICNMLSTDIGEAYWCLMGLKKILQVSRSQNNMETRGYGQMVVQENGVHIITNLKNHNDRNVTDLAKKILKQLAACPTTTRKAILVALREELPYIEQETTDIEDLLLKKYMFEEETILTLADYGNYQKATKNNIRKEAKSAAQEKPPLRQLFLFISGHGGKHNNKYAIWPTHGYQAQQKGEVLTAEFWQNFVEHTQPNTRVTVFMDYCHAGGFFKEAKLENEDRGKVVFFGACEENQITSSGSFITGAVMPILKNLRGRITHKELLLRIKEKYREMGLKTNPVLYCTAAMEEEYLLEEEELEEEEDV